MKANQLYVPKQKITKGYSCEEFSISYESEIDDGEVLDTKVILNGGDQLTTLCWIAGNDISAFNEELTQLFNKHRI